MRIVGVDPGLSGALALLDDLKLVEVADMPVLRIRKGKTDKGEVDAYTLSLIIEKWRPDIAFIEQVGGLPGQSAPAAFNFGHAAGMADGVMKALRVRVERVSPVTWKRALNLQNAGKDGARAAAMRRWPELSSLFSRKKDDGRAESALIAEWGFKQQKGSIDYDVFN